MSIPVIPIPVCFFDTPILLIIYITTYISISYIIYKESLYAHFSNWNWNNWNLNTFVRWLLPSYRLFLYKTRHDEKFLGSLTAEVLKREVLAVTRAVERRVQRTVIGTAHINVLPHINVRVTLLRCRMALQEGVVVFPVAHQHDDIERQTSSRATGAVLSF